LRIGGVRLGSFWSRDYIWKTW